MSEFNIIPVFPCVIGATKVTEDLSSLWDSLDNLEFFETTSDDSHLTYSSKNMNLLDSHLKIRQLILNYFNEFKNNTLKLDTTKFDITTSWMTLTKPGGHCQYHSHKNSFYSGVLYKNKTNDVDSGNLLFSDMGIKPQTILINDPSEWNILNSRRITIEPDDNLLVFFPSELRHRISKYTGNTNRYSLAFNLFPIGRIGTGDSFLNIG